MTNISLTGIHFGDEGKGKMEGYLLETAIPPFHVVARYGGADNAGHTSTEEDRSGRKIINHLVPGGILKPGIYNIILADVMVDPIELVKEIMYLEREGYVVSPENFGISSRAQMTLEYHKEFEREREEKKGKEAIGTTMKGVGPTAISKYAREPVRFEEFLSYDSFRRLLGSFSRERGNVVAKEVDVDRYIGMYGEAIEFLRQFRVDEAEVIRRLKDKNWIYEGSQGILLDVLYGSVPYVTSSTPHNPPPDTDERIGVAKAYITRVGGGNLPTRMEEGIEKMIRGCVDKTPGAEFGATTGRPRNCGWFDAVATKYAVSIGRIDKIALIKLDRLSGLPVIKVGTKYRIRGDVTKSFPADRFDFEEARGVYEEYPGWPDDISSAREFRDLPINGQDYVKRLEDMMECRIAYVSVGQGSEQTIER